MTKITFIVLAHESPRDLIPLIEALVGEQEELHLCLHYDRASPEEHYQLLKEHFANSTRVAVLSERVKCAWGEFSLVDATLLAMRFIEQSTWRPDRVYLLSGSCFPVRPISELQIFLESHPDTEFIESHAETWIIGGLTKERYEYHHWLNERKYRGLFYASEYVQRKLGMKRRFPEGLTPRFGSQWWCLTWRMCQEILNFLERRPEVYRFFKTTWIPDELFFQTLAYAHAPERLSDRSLTYHRFSNQAKPMVFHEDHADVLVKLPFFFARKISPRARKLRTHLLKIAQLAARSLEPIEHADPSTDFNIPVRVAAQVTRPKPNQIYYGDQLRGQWQGVLRALRKPIIVLYGPPLLTRTASQEFARDPRFSVFGRLLARDAVEFGGEASHFEGLLSTDVKIRDYDRANYLARVFERGGGLPVFQMSPLDYPEGQGLFHSDERVIFLMCAPKMARRPRSSAEDVGSNEMRMDWFRLFWALSVCERGDFSEEPRTGARNARRQLDAYIRRILWPEHINWTEDRIRELDNFTRGAAPLYWHVGSQDKFESDDFPFWSLRLFLHSAPTGLLASEMSQRLPPMNLDWNQILEVLPANARSAISTLFGLQVDRHLASSVAPSGRPTTR